jgi:hypothetical protein
MRPLIATTFVLYLIVGCTDSTTESNTESSSQPQPSLPKISLGPGLGGSQLQTDGLSYVLSCAEGTISLDLGIGIEEGLETTWVGTRRRADTGTDFLKCSLAEGSVSTSSDADRQRSLARAGTWVCDGDDANFTMSGYFASVSTAEGTEHNLLKTRPLEWQLSESTPCLFSVD